VWWWWWSSRWQVLISLVLSLSLSHSVQPPIGDVFLVNLLAGMMTQTIPESRVPRTERAALIHDFLSLYFPHIYLQQNDSNSLIVSTTATFSSEADASASVFPLDGLPSLMRILTKCLYVSIRPDSARLASGHLLASNSLV